MKEFLLVVVGFIFGAAIGVEGFTNILGKVWGLFS